MVCTICGNKADTLRLCFDCDKYVCDSKGCFIDVEFESGLTLVKYIVCYNCGKDEYELCEICGIRVISDDHICRGHSKPRFCSECVLYTLCGYCHEKCCVNDNNNTGC